MTEGSRRLIEAGFFSDDFKKDYPGWREASPEEQQKILDTLEKDGKLEGYADHDSMEIAKDQMMLMDYPLPKSRYYLIYEVPHESIEPIYFWSLGHLTYDWGFPIVHKITDIFTAAEHSSFYGASAQRLGLAQDKVSQYLATIGKMIKDMFQLVRELRWIDERKQYYEDADKGYSGAEQALKGLWADMVDGVVGGQRTTSNIFSMAQQLQFAALPDLFFSIPITKDTVPLASGKPLESAIDKVVEQRAADFNKELRNILKRKFYQYLIWKKETFKEIAQRRRFTLDYLKQHWNVIRMYIAWVKPYLKHIKKLGADIGKLSSADLIAAFEGSLVEIEILAQKVPEGNKKYFTCILLTFQYRTRPSLQFSQEGGFHRGPVHLGETRIFWRAYSWTEKQIEAFKQMKDKEDFDLVTSIDKSLEAAMNALGDDLDKYLKEAEEMHAAEKKKPEAKVQKMDLLEPFKEVGKGFKEFFTVFGAPKGKPKKPTKAEIEAEQKEKEAAAKDAVKTLWQHYKNFKKAHRLLTW
jgi:hypothetical protein